MLQVATSPAAQHRQRRQPQPMDHDAQAANLPLVAAFYQSWKARVGLPAGSAAAPAARSPSSSTACFGSRWQRARHAAVRARAAVGPAGGEPTDSSAHCKPLAALSTSGRHAGLLCSSTDRAAPTQQHRASRWRSLDILAALRRRARHRPVVQTSQSAGAELAIGDGALPRAVTRGALALGRVLGMASASVAPAPADTAAVDKTLSNVRPTRAHTHRSRAVRALALMRTASPRVVLQYSGHSALHCSACSLCAMGTCEGDSQHGCDFASAT